MTRKSYGASANRDRVNSSSAGRNSLDSSRIKAATNVDISEVKNGVRNQVLSSINAGSMIEMKHDSGHVSAADGENVLVGTWKIPGP
jgi:hypothetical protein